jgi:hypothetical protein
VTRKGSTMGDGHGATGTRQQRLMLVGLLVGLLMMSAAPGYAQRGEQGGHGFRSSPPRDHGGHGSPQGGHGFRSSPPRDRGGHGSPQGGHGFRSSPPRDRGGHGGRHRGHAFVWPEVVVPVWPYWNPYWDLYVPPPSIVVPPPRVYVEPTPYAWYYCENPRGYYPYVQQCPGGWLPVAPPR